MYVSKLGVYEELSEKFSWGSEVEFGLVVSSATGEWG